MNVLGVLSRADEIGSCRMDSLEVADRVAHRYQNDSRLRRLCPVVVPVAGLLGYAGATLGEAQFAALARVAALPASERTALLLTADRFRAGQSVLDLTDLERTHLRTGGCTGSASLQTRIEQLMVGTHAFAELRLLTTVRTDDLGIDPERLQELDRIPGGSGHDAASRLALDSGAEQEIIRDSALEALHRWRRVAAHPMSSRPLQLAALGACRTLEEGLHRGVVTRVTARDHGQLGEAAQYETVAVVPVQLVDGDGEPQLGEAT
jgi:hypothetical protein